MVHKINKMARETVERGQMDIGNLVLNEVFEGILDKACSKDPYKNKSLQLVCSDPDLMVKRRRLGEWVRTAALRKELIAKKVDCSNLSYSHFAALLQVDDVKERNMLAATANKGQLSARKLIDKIGKKIAGKDSKAMVQATSQPSGMTVARLLEALENHQALMEDRQAQQILENPQDLEKLSFDERLQVARCAERLFKLMVSSVNLLKLAKKNIASIDMAWDDAIDVQAIDV